MNDSDLNAREAPYSVYLVDKRGVRRLVCRRPTVVDCAEVIDQLLRGAPGVTVEAIQDANVPADTNMD